VGDSEAIVAPGLFDLQVNGADGHDLQAPELTPDTVHAVNKHLNAHGVFQWMPTLVTDSAEALEHKCRVLAEALRDCALAWHIPGIHLEGPHISPVDGPRGAHPAAHVILPDLKLFRRLQRAAEGRIRCVTLAPELNGAAAFIRALTAQGVVVALGHHAAEAKHIHAAADAGARLCTHLGNGMAPCIHRHQNPLWPQLADDRLYASVIADLEHVPPDLLQVILRAKTARRMILVSDSVFLSGMKPGRYSIFGAEVELKRSGRVCLAETELLAGSSLLLPDAVMNMVRATDMNPARAFDSASRVPARLMGVSHAAWPPRAGCPAEFVLYSGTCLTGSAKAKPLFVFNG
jgi:N-acetylglucosamine-6-phosphate deacetylase